MASLGMTASEYQLYVTNITEAFKLIGQDALLYQVESDNKDMYDDPNTVLS